MSPDSLATLVVALAIVTFAVCLFFRATRQETETKTKTKIKTKTEKPVMPKCKMEDALASGEFKLTKDGSIDQRCKREFLKYDRDSPHKNGLWSS